MSLLQQLRLALRYEWTRRSAEWHSILMPMAFFLALALLFPLALGPGEQRLAQFAPVLVWVTVLLAVFVSMGNMFRRELDEGVLLFWVSSGRSTLIWALSALLLWALLYALPLMLCSLLLLYGLGVEAPLTVWIKLVLALPGLLVLGGLGSALAYARGGLLQLVLVLPLAFPLLIFGASPQGGVFWLAALSVFNLLWGLPALRTVLHLHLE